MTKLELHTDFRSFQLEIFRHLCGNNQRFFSTIN